MHPNLDEQHFVVALRLAASCFLLCNAERGLPALSHLSQEYRTLACLIDETQGEQRSESEGSIRIYTRGLTEFHAAPAIGQSRSISQRPGPRLLGQERHVKGRCQSGKGEHLKEKQGRKGGAVLLWSF